MVREHGRGKVANTIRGVKMFPTKMSRDVGMVHCMSEITCSCIEILEQKVQERRCIHDIVTSQVNIRQLQDTLDTLSPALQLATCVGKLACMHTKRRKYATKWRSNETTGGSALRVESGNSRVNRLTSNAHLLPV